MLLINRLIFFKGDISDDELSLKLRKLYRKLCDNPHPLAENLSSISSALKQYCEGKSHF